MILLCTLRVLALIDKFKSNSFLFKAEEVMFLPFGIITKNTLKNIISSALDKKKFDLNLSISAKIRSVHNNIITFLVLFIMLSGWHAYFIWTSQWNWIILLLLAIILGFVSHFFNLKAKEKI